MKTLTTPASPAWLKQSPIVGLENPLEAWKGLRAPSLMQLLELAAPPVASRFAEKIFLTPPRFEAPVHEKQLLLDAHRFRIPYRGGSLAAWSWHLEAGAGPTVFLLHGWAGRAGQMAHFVAPLLERGGSVIAFDGPAHGLSDGREASMVHFRDALLHVVATHGPGHAIIAHSMGCASTALALDAGMQTERIVMIGAPGEAL